MTKSISILIPAYNAEKTIGSCLESIAAQTFTDYEIIVSNDGSTDNTVAEVERFKSDNPKLEVKLISNPNGGVSLARKRALECAIGEWITFVDADDTLPANALTDLFALAGSDTDLVVGSLTPTDKRIEEMNKPILWQHAVVQGITPPLFGESYTVNLCCTHQCLIYPAT